MSIGFGKASEQLSEALDQVKKENLKILLFFNLKNFTNFLKIQPFQKVKKMEINQRFCWI